MHTTVKARQSRTFSGFCENNLLLYFKKSIYSASSSSIVEKYKFFINLLVFFMFTIYFNHILSSTASFLNYGLLIYGRITALLVGSAPLIFLSPLCICSLLCENLFWIGMCQNCMQCSKCGSSIDLYNSLITFSNLFSIPYIVVSDFFLPF